MGHPLSANATVSEISMIEGEGLSWGEEGEGAGETMKFGATCMNLVCTIVPWLSDIIVPIGIISLLRGETFCDNIFLFLYNIEILFFLVYCLSHSPSSHLSPFLSLPFSLSLSHCYRSVDPWVQRSPVSTTSSHPPSVPRGVWGEPVSTSAAYQRNSCTKPLCWVRVRESGLA